MIKVTDTNSELLIYIKDGNLIVSKKDNNTGKETQLVNVFTDLNMTVRMPMVEVTNDTGLVSKIEAFYFDYNDFFKEKP